MHVHVPCPLQGFLHHRLCLDGKAEAPQRMRAIQEASDSRIVSELNKVKRRVSGSAGLEAFLCL